MSSSKVYISDIKNNTSSGKNKIGSKSRVDSSKTVLPVFVETRYPFGVEWERSLVFTNAVEFNNS